MADKRHTTTDLADWLHRLEGLSRMASATDEADEADLIRQFYALLDRAPTPALMDGLSLPDALRFEAMLISGAHDSAILAFMGYDTGYCISRGTQGMHLASVILPRCGDEITASGITMPLACLAALAQALIEVAPTPHKRANQTASRSTLLH